MNAAHDWYGNGMVTLFKHGISFRYTFIEKTNFLTSLKTKIKEIKLIKMKRLQTTKTCTLNP